MDHSDLRASIPALEDGIYLNTGASGPSPRQVVDAAENALEYQEYDAPFSEVEGAYTAAFDSDEAARESIADLLSASPTEIALTQSTTDGINHIASAIDWNEGDVIVRTDLEHAAGILPWKRLERHRGLEIRVLETENGYLDLGDVREAVADARLVCFSSMTWTHGTRLPVREIVEIAHDAGAFVLVDAVQSVGQTPVDVEAWGADFVAAAGHKWLLGPFGSGFLYVRDGIEDDLVPSTIGYRSVEEPDAEEYRFKSNAQRFEVGTTNPAPHAGLVTAIEMIDDIGLETIEDRLEALTDRLKAGVPEERLLSPEHFESGLVTIAVEDPEATVDRLRELDIVVRSVPLPESTSGSGARTDRDTPASAIRASVHFFNTKSEIDALLEAL